MLPVIDIGTTSPQRVLKHSPGRGSPDGAQRFIVPPRGKGAHRDMYNSKGKLPPLSPGRDISPSELSPRARSIMNQTWRSVIAASPIDLHGKKLVMSLSTRYFEERAGGLVPSPPPGSRQRMRKAGSSYKVSVTDLSPSTEAHRARVRSPPSPMDVGSSPTSPGSKVARTEASPNAIRAGLTSTTSQGNDSPPKGAKAPGSPDGGSPKGARATSTTTTTMVLPISDHNTPGIGMRAAASSMSLPKTWNSAKARIAEMMSRARRGSRDVELDDLVPLSADDPPWGGLPTDALSLLSKVPWFRSFSNTQLHKILDRCKVAYFAADAVIVRENSHGSAFYVLLDGLVCATSSRRRIDVALKPGESFGETALLTLVQSMKVRREASVTALQDSWCLRMRAADVADMPSHDFYALHKIFIAKLLADVRFFNKLTPSQLEELAHLMEFKQYSAKRVVFEENAVADKLYILVWGAVGMFKRIEADTNTQTAVPIPTDNSFSMGSGGSESFRRSQRGADADAPMGQSTDASEDTPSMAREVLLAEFDAHSKYPWFGESALAAFLRGDTEVPMRSAAAFTLQDTMLLSLDVNKAGRMVEVLPEFAKIVKVGSKAYQVTNQLHGFAK